MLATPAASRAACANAIACENQRPGATPASWQIKGAGDPSIQGFATAMSVDRGQTISFKIRSATPDYRIDILRLGYYGGAGAGLLASGVPHSGTGDQPDCLTDSGTGLIDCGNWSVSASWAVPANAVSGLYVAYLRRNDTGGASQIFFVVRDDGGHSDIVVQTSDSTWQAYNAYGGNSLYGCTPPLCPPGSPRVYKGAFKVSYNRPLTVAASQPTSAPLGPEYSMIRFLEGSGYDVSYVSSADVASRPGLLDDHRVFMSSGHDEYWSGDQRRNVEAARDAGVNLAFFSGNEAFWKTRWEPSIDGSGTPDRTLVSYKDTHFDSRQDPVEWTGTWLDPRYTDPEDGVMPANELTGQTFVVDSGTSDITVPAAYGRLRMWRNTAAAGLAPGDSLRLAPSTLGYEWDEDADNGFRPPGEFRLSSTTVSGVNALTDYGNTVRANDTATHSLTMYRASSGALVFGAGTVQWAWGLDARNPANSPPDRNMQQATVNLLADMGAQPATPMPGLITAAPSTDTIAPASTITDLPSAVADGDRVTVAGTAADSGGGVVAGVEVSTDGGSTWHPADGTTRWSYSWIAHGSPSITIRTRAVDDSGNLENPGPGRSLGVSCPCSLWGVNVAPAQPDAGDASAVEVGVKFRVDQPGSITGLRFYKSAANTGTHVGSVWTEAGQRLGRVTFSGETASGWQSATFDQPVDVQPGATYIASYYAPAGHYAATVNYFWRAPAPGPGGGALVDSPPLHGVRDHANGVYSYAGSSTFPVNTFIAANYWVDVVFSPQAPGAVTGVTATASGQTSAIVSWSRPTSGGAPASYRITPYLGSTAQTPTSVTGSPPATTATIAGLTAGNEYTFTVQAVNDGGSGPESPHSNPVTPQVAALPGAPTGVAAQGASSSAWVTWIPPASDPDHPITGYTVTPYAGAVAQPQVHPGPSATAATITGLTNGTAYTFRVSASSQAGTGPDSAASGPVTPWATIFDFATPAVVDSADAGSVELGVKFRPDFDGSVTGVRFYKAPGNMGGHVGSLWTAGGQRLAQATFSNETASGWQSVMFGSPVPVSAGTTYVASYFAPSGHYSYTGGGLASATDNPPLHTLANATSPDGVYAYSSTSTFPSSAYNAANYWVDVMYSPSAPGAVGNVAAVPTGRTSATVSWSAPSGGGPPSSYRITPYAGSDPQSAITVAGSATSAAVTGLTAGTQYTFTIRAFNEGGAGPESDRSNAITPGSDTPPAPPTDVVARPASRSALVSWSPPADDGGSPVTTQTVTPYVGSAAQTPVQVGRTATSTTVSGLTNGTSYTFTVTATNSAGTSPPSDRSNAVAPAATIFDFATPAVIDSLDSGAVELGVKFRSDVAGAVTGLRFYKAAANTGPHVGSLWTADGQRLAQATFTGESASGWQSVTFDAPVAIEPNTTYVASYFAPHGHYSYTGAAFASASVGDAPLSALANTTSPNGVYRYGGSGAFPTQTFNSANYWVDVLFDEVSSRGS